MTGPMSHPGQPKIHYKAPYTRDAERAICGAHDKHEITARPLRVTCERCKLTPAYREMMEP